MYTGYNEVTSTGGRTRAACLAHAWRRFFDAVVRQNPGVTVGNRDVLAVYARMVRGRICSRASDRWQLPALPHVGQLLAMAAAVRRPSSAGTSRLGGGQAARRSYRWCRPRTDCFEVRECGRQRAR